MFGLLQARKHYSYNFTTDSKWFHFQGYKGCAFHVRFQTIFLLEGCVLISHSFSGIPEELIFLNHRVTGIKHDGVDTYDDKCDSVSESGNESDDSGKTVIDPNEDDRVSSEKLQIPPALEESETGIVVDCENGAMFQADCAVCTLPLGVLKDRIASLFVPPLPDYKIEAVNRLLFGTVDKIFLGYERPFLNPGVSEVLLLWENDCDTSKTENGRYFCKANFS